MELGKEKPRVEVSSVLSIEDWEGRGAVQISHLVGGGGGLGGKRRLKGRERGGGVLET